MKLNEVTGYNLRSQSILNESWETLTESQRMYMAKSERELWPLMEELVKVFEAQLTAQQIQAIFQNAEEVAMSSGDNATALGKAGSAAAGAAKLPGKVLKAVNDKINELGRMAQKAGPVANADAKVEQLKKDITKSNPKLANKIQAVSDWVKENPKKASLGVAILTAAAAFAAGPAGGAAVGFLLRSTNEMLKGEKLSTSVGKAAKTAAVGALAGVALDNLGDAVLDNFAAAADAEIEGMIDDFENANVEMAMNNIDADLQALFPELEDASRYQMSGSINRFYYNYDIVMTPEIMDQYEELKSAVDGTEKFSDEFYQKSAELHDFLAGVQNDPMQEQYRSALEALRAAQESEALSSQQWDAVLAADDELTDKLNALSKLDDSVAAAVQAGAQQADTLKDKAVKVSRPKQGDLDLDNPNESLSMEERFELFLMEKDPRQGELPLDNPNSLGAKLKRGAKAAASKAGSAVKGAASSAAGAVKQAGKDLGNKVTANKLMKAWKSLGEPTDTASIVNILSDAGMSTDQISQVGQQNKVDLKPAAQAPAQTDANGDSKDDTTGKPIEKPRTRVPAGISQGVDLKSLASEIKKAGVADQVKQMLS